MRVGLIIYGSINTTSGGYIYDYKLVEYLQSKGMEVRIFSQKKTKLGILGNNFSRKMANEILEFSPDVLLQDEMNFSSLFLLNKKLKKMGTFPIISIVHLLQANALHHVLAPWFIKKIEKLYLKTVDGFIFNSIATELAISGIIGKKSNSIIAYPGKDRLQLNTVEECIHLKCQNKKLRIIFIGNLLYNKGLHVLLHALSEIDPALWELSIVGNLRVDLAYTRKILKMIVQLKLDANIKLCGLLDVDHLKEELQSQHVLIVPSYYESYGIVYTEAMGAGIPIIASKTGGVPEIVNDAGNGFLITPGDVEMLRECIIKLMQDRDLLKRMSFSALSAYRNFPSWNESMAEIHKFLYQNSANLTACGKKQAVEGQIRA